MIGVTTRYNTLCTFGPFTFVHEMPLSPRSFALQGSVTSEPISLTKLCGRESMEGVCFDARSSLGASLLTSENCAASGRASIIGEINEEREREREKRMKNT